MKKYIIKRCLLVIPITLGVTFIVFFILSLTPGDPGRLILGMNATAEEVAKLNHQLGVDQSFFVRFFNFIGGALHGDFGISYNSQRPVITEIVATFPHSLRLAVWGTIIAYLIGIPIGIYSAVRQYSAVDVGSTVVAMFFAAVPQFWLALMMILLFSLQLHMLPPSGIDTWRNFVMPIAVIALPQAAITSRLTRTSMLETIQQDYIRTARAKGLPEWKVIWKHAFKNALLPILVTLITTFGLSLGGLVLIENVFSVPGIGNLILTGIRQEVVPVVMAATIFLALIYCMLVLLADIIMAYIDPRIRNVYLRK